MYLKRRKCKYTPCYNLLVTRWRSLIFLSDPLKHSIFLPFSIMILFISCLYYGRCSIFLSFKWRKSKALPAIIFESPFEALSIFLSHPLKLSILLLLFYYSITSLNCRRCWISIYFKWRKSKILPAIIF